MKNAEIIELYRRWSEEIYCAGFMSPTASSVAEFRTWLINPKATWNLAIAEDYEFEMLAEYHRQETDSA